jgi:hypothetical protein
MKEATSDNVFLWSLSEKIWKRLISIVRLLGCPWHPGVLGYTHEVALLSSIQICFLGLTYRRATLTNTSAVTSILTSKTLKKVNTRVLYLRENSITLIQSCIWIPWSLAYVIPLGIKGINR